MVNIQRKRTKPKLDVLDLDILRRFESGPSHLREVCRKLKEYYEKRGLNKKVQNETVRLRLKKLNRLGYLEPTPSDKNDHKMAKRMILTIKGRMALDEIAIDAVSGETMLNSLRPKGSSRKFTTQVTYTDGLVSVSTEETPTGDLRFTANSSGKLTRLKIQGQDNTSNAF